MSNGRIYAAIPAILADMDAIGKEKKNQQQGFMYRGIDDVYNAVHPLFAKHKVFPTCEILSRELTERATKTGGVLFYVNMRAKYTLWADDGSSVTTEAWGEAMDSGDKASNKAMSVAYKYALFQLLCIPTEAVDPDEQLHQVAPPAARPADAYERTGRQPPRRPPPEHLPPSERTTSQLQTGDLDDPIEAAKAKAEAGRTPEQLYNSAKGAIAGAKNETKLESIRGGVQQYGADGTFNEDQVRTLENLIEKRLESLSAAGAAA